MGLFRMFVSNGRKHWRKPRQELVRCSSVCISPRDLEDNVEKEHVKGTVDKAKGVVKEGVGNLAGDEKLRQQGKADKVKGELEKAKGDAKGVLRDRVNQGVDKI